MLGLYFPTHLPLDQLFFLVNCCTIVIILSLLLHCYVPHEYIIILSFYDIFCRIQKNDSIMHNELKVCFPKCEQLCAAFINLKTHGVAEQTETVVDVLWKFSTPFVPSDFPQFRLFIEEDGKEKRLAKSWRKVVNLIDDQLDGAWKIERDEFKVKYLYDSLPP